MSLTGTVLVEPNVGVASWFTSNNIPDTFPTDLDAFDMSQTKWSTYLPGGTNAAGFGPDVAGANFVHVFIWAEAARPSRPTTSTLLFWPRSSQPIAARFFPSWFAA